MREMKMSDIPKDFKELISELLKSSKELNDQIKPLIKGVTEQEDILIKHNLIIDKLSEMTLNNKEKIKEIKSLHEMYVEKIDGALNKHSGVHEDIEIQLKDLKYRPIQTIYRKAKKYKKISERDYEQISDFIDLYPDDSIVYSTIGHIYWNTNEDEEKTRNYFKKSVELDANNIVGRCGLITFSDNKEDFITHLEGIKKIDEDIRCPTLLYNVTENYAKFKDYEKAIYYADKYLEKHPDDPKSYEIKGNILSNYMDKPAQAISILEKGLSYDSKNLRILNQMGMAYRRLDMDDKSISIYKKMLEIDGNRISALHNLSLTYFDNERYEEALSLSNKAIEIEPSSCEYCIRGRIFSLLDKKDESISDFKQALNIYDNKAKTCEVIFRYYFISIMDKDENEIESIIKDTYSKYKNNTNYLVALISLYNKLNKKELIMDIIKKLTPDVINISINLNSVAYTLYKIDEAEMAYDYSKKLIELVENIPEYLDTHACILSKLGRDGEAKEYFIKAIEIGKKDNITWDEMKSLFTRINENELYQKLLDNIEE